MWGKDVLDIRLVKMKTAHLVLCIVTITMLVDAQRHLCAKERQEDLNRKENAFEKRAREIQEQARKSHDPEVIFGSCQCEECQKKRGKEKA